MRRTTLASSWPRAVKASVREDSSSWLMASSSAVWSSLPARGATAELVKLVDAILQFFDLFLVSCAELLRLDELELVLAELVLVVARRFGQGGQLVLEARDFSLELFLVGIFRRLTAISMDAVALNELRELGNVPLGVLQRFVRVQEAGFIVGQSCLELRDFCNASIGCLRSLFQLLSKTPSIFKCVLRRLLSLVKLAKHVLHPLRQLGTLRVRHILGATLLHKRLLGR